MTTNKPLPSSTVKSVQAGRAVAAILVVLIHVGGALSMPKYLGAQPVGPIFEFGFVAVDFFFVLSGFIIIIAHQRDIGKPQECGPYLWKRMSRIFLPYWVVLVLIVPVFLLVPRFGLGHERDPGALLCSVFLLKHPTEHTVLAVAWTMIYEVFFYALFVSFIFSRRLGTIVFVVWGAGVLAFSWFDSYPWTFIFSHWNIRILGGMVTALIVNRVRIPVPRLTALAGVAILVVAGMVHVYHHHLSVPLYAFAGTVGGMLAILGLTHAERNGSLSSPRWLVYLGDATYAIYLVHFPAISALAKLTMLTGLNELLSASVLFLLHAVLSIAAGCVFYEIVDKPLYHWARKWIRRPERAAVVEAAAPPMSKAA